MARGVVLNSDWGMEPMVGVERAWGKEPPRLGVDRALACCS